eukprot:8108000-Alexandrium_andersonii.AAC.1
MSASLVGSEMCIRDSLTWSQRSCVACRQVARAKCWAARRRSPTDAKGVARSAATSSRGRSGGTSFSLYQKACESESERSSHRSSRSRARPRAP